MVFATDAVRFQFGQLHPDSRAVAIELDEFMVAMKQPEVYITCIDRTEEDQRRIYTPIGLRLLERYAAGEPLSPRDMRDVVKLRTLLKTRRSDETARDVVAVWAEQRPSWHRRHTAFDVRNTIYPEDVQRAAEKWLRQRCVGDAWELIFDTHGTGPHWHIARRSWDWLKTVTGYV